MVISHSHVSFPGLNYDPVRGLRLKSCQNPALFQWILSQALPGPSMGTPKWTHEGSGRVSKKEPIAWKKSDEVLLELEWIGYQMNTEKIIIYQLDHFQHPTFQTFRLLSPVLPPGKTHPCHPSRCHDVLSFWDELSKVFPLPLGVVDGIASQRRFFTGKHGENHGEKHGFTMKIRGFHQQECEDQNCFFEIWGKLMVWLCKFAMPFGSIWYSIYLLDPIGVVKAPATSSMWIHQG